MYMYMYCTYVHVDRVTHGIQYYKGQLLRSTFTFSINRFLVLIDVCRIHAVVTCLCVQCTRAC